MKYQAFNEINGCGILDLDPREDQHGYVVEMFNRKKIASDGIPIPWGFHQESISWTDKVVQRGFYIQPDRPQGKLVTCLGGKVLSVCLDLRPKSETFLKMTRVMLMAEYPKSFWMPTGTAHAFLAFEHSCLHTLATTEASVSGIIGIDSMSPELAMVWPPGEFKRPELDQGFPKLMDYVATLR